MPLQTASPSITLVHSTDWHLQPGNPPSRLGSYSRDILDKVKRIGGIARDYGADLLTCGGDVFNKKEPKFTTHRLVAETIGVLGSLGLPVYCVVGNHDIEFDKEDTLPRQPLGVLFESGAMIRQVSQVITKEDFSIRLKGIPFAEEPELSSLVLTKEEEAMADKHVLSLHVYATPSGGFLHAQKMHSYADLAALGYDVVLLGHYHADQGVQRVKGPRGVCTIVNIGSLSRGDYGDENLDRVPKCCVVSLSASGVTTEEVAVGAKPASEVFDLVKKAEVAEHSAKAAEFVAELRRATLEEEQKPVGTVEEELVGLELTDVKVLKKVQGFIASANEILQGAK